MFPSARCELFYSKDYELVIAVMLSAQTTDKSVNAVTPILFNKYPSLEDLNNAPLEDIEEILKPIGLYKNKAKNLKGIVKDLLERFNGKVPFAKKEDEPIDVERRLKKLIPEERWIKSHHQLIHFGRYFCTARNPQCEKCKISDMCTNKRK